jgi:hypothetical protein
MVPVVILFKFNTIFFSPREALQLAPQRYETHKGMTEPCSGYKSSVYLSTYVAPLYDHVSYSSYFVAYRMAWALHVLD